MSSLDDTICAVATPVGEGGVGIVRVSGPKAIPIVTRVLRLRSGKTLQEVKPYRMYLGNFLAESAGDPGNHARPSALALDEVLVVKMVGPHSYTGEDVVEIHGHGGSVILQTMCGSLVEAGARLAQPGEFTKRAFLSGRLDLTQAEAVLDTIQATSLKSVYLAQEHLQGKFSRYIQEQRDTLVKLIAHIEAGMDFGEEDIQFIQQPEIKDTIQQVMGALSQLIQSAEEGQIIREGIRTVIVGKPNVGKSSLLNALLGADRAIVSSVPGTTRDIIEESITVDGMLIRFFDTAGLRDTGDEIESEGMSRAEKAVGQADVVVLAIDQSDILTEKDVNIINTIKSKPWVTALTKGDLPSKFTPEEYGQWIKQRIPNHEKATSLDNLVLVSAKTDQGIGDLKQAILKKVLGQPAEAGETIFVSRLRHRNLLQQALEALHNALKAMEDTSSSECLALELRMGLNHLGEIVGAVTNEEILDHIFRDFCIGK